MRLAAWPPKRELVASHWPIDEWGRGTAGGTVPLQERVRGGRADPAAAPFASPVPPCPRSARPATDFCNVAQAAPSPAGSR
jgi:hypothetical protein